MSAIPYPSFIQDFNIAKNIGKGNCAVVNLIYHTLDKKYYAHKQITAHSSQEISQALNQIEVAICLDEEKVTKIHYYYLHHHKYGNYELGLIMQLCQCTLTQSIKDRKKKTQYFKIEDINTFLEAMIPLFVRMQKRGYLHRDIKPDNILLAKGRKLDFRLADFGFALKLNCYSSRNVAGTMEYVSPKLKVKFQNQKKSVPGHNIKDDVYSLGKTLSQMMLLQIGQEFTPRKLAECKNRYGDVYSKLLDMMMEINEQKRADFITIYDYVLENQIIEDKMISRKSSYSLDRLSSKTKLKGNSIVKVETTSSSHLKPHNFTLSTVTTHPATPRNNRDSKTKCKGVKHQSDTEQSSVKNQFIQQQPKEIKIKAPIIQSGRWYNRKMNQKILKTKEEILCIAHTDQLVFLGLEDKLGIVILATNKQIRLPHIGESFNQICFLKVSQNQEILYICTLNSKIYTISIIQVNNLVLKNDKSLSLMNIVEVSFNCLTSRAITMDAPVSTIDLLSDNTFEHTCAVVGHYTGGISLISKGDIKKLLSFISAPLSKIQIANDTVYFSTSDGLFKRLNAPTLGISLKNHHPFAHNHNDVIASAFRTNSYQCQAAIVNFQLINECLFNKNIAQNQNQHFLVVLACYDGFIHILSKQMKCQKMIRVCPTQMLAVFLKVSKQETDGFEGIFVGQNGNLYEQKGMKIKELGTKRIAAISCSQNGIYCGGFDKSVVILTPQSPSIDLG